MRSWLLICTIVCCSSCTSLEVVRLRPDLLQTPRGTEPLAAIQATCVGFYLFTLGIPNCDMDKVLNQMLATAARKLGAKRLIQVHHEGTPEGGIWWLTKLFWWRTARATGIAVVAEPADEPLFPPEKRKSRPASRPASAPASRAASGGR